MTQVHFGFVMPADQLDKTRRTTFVHDLERALELVSGHFHSAWIIDHLQFGDQDDDDFDFVGTPQQVVEQMRPLVELGTDCFMLDCKAFLRLTTLESLVRDVLPTWN
jgi:alkanesulfonate monooxygenase SsuD/methylene tetrahydromethanopterin reductase-like flavin-dependent oxidoreductase (luciferase family)